MESFCTEWNQEMKSVWVGDKLQNVAGLLSAVISEINVFLMTPAVIFDTKVRCDKLYARATI